MASFELDNGDGLTQKRNRHYTSEANFAKEEESERKGRLLERDLIKWDFNLYIFSLHVEPDLQTLSDVYTRDNIMVALNNYFDHCPT